MNKKYIELFLELVVLVFAGWVIYLRLFFIGSNSLLAPFLYLGRAKGFLIILSVIIILILARWGFLIKKAYAST